MLLYHKNNTIANNNEPIKLNIKWIIEALRAFVVAPSEDKIASIVVPMLLPKTKAAESFQLIEPAAAIVKMIAVKALEEWMRPVKTAPIKTPTMIPKNSQSVMLFIKLTDFGFNERVSPSKSKPKNNIPKPRKRSEKFLIFDFFNDFRKKPIPINGIAIADTLKSVAL